MTETTFSIAHHDLARLVGIVGPSVGTDALLPIFTCLHLSEHEGRIEVAATDRYTFAVARGVAKVPDGMDFVLPLKSVRHILATFEPGYPTTADLAFAVGQSVVHVATTEPDIDRIATAVTYNKFPEAFPVTRHFDIAPSDDMSPLDPAYMHRLPTLNHNEPAMFRAGGPGKVSAVYGPDWVIYIMAMRAAEGQPDWTAQWATKDAKVATTDEPVSA